MSVYCYARVVGYHYSLCKIAWPLKNAPEIDSGRFTGKIARIFFHYLSKLVWYTDFTTQCRISYMLRIFAHNILKTTGAWRDCTKTMTSSFLGSNHQQGTFASGRQTKPAQTTNQTIGWNWKGKRLTATSSRTIFVALIEQYTFESCRLLSQTYKAIISLE